MQTFFENNTPLPSWSRRSAETAHSHYPTLIQQLQHAAWATSEICYWSFSFYEIILPVLLARYRSIHIPIPVKLDLAWNFINGISSIWIGLTQLLDNQTHRPWCQRIKGCINLSSGLQLLVLSAMCSPAAPVAFVVASIADFILSLETLLHEFRRWYSFDYWLQDTLAELNKRQLEIMNESAKKEIVLQQLQQTAQDKRLYQDLNWIIGQKQNHIQALFAESDKIRAQVIIRFTTGQARQESLKKIIENDASILQSLAIDNSFLTTIEAGQDIQSLLKRNVPNNAAAPLDLTTEEKICQQLYHTMLQALVESIILALIAAGWILFCIPSMQVPAMILISITVCYYLLKNSMQLYRFFWPNQHLTTDGQLFQPDATTLTTRAPAKRTELKTQSTSAFCVSPEKIIGAGCVF